MDIRYNIRELGAEETQTALSLVWRVFTEYEAPDYTEEGAEEFRRSINDADYLSKLRFYGAFVHERMVGVIAVRSLGTHIALLFVDGEYHRNGIGKALFRTAAAECMADTMTVNSSPYALGFYHKLGFRDTAAEQNVNGLRFTPMESELR